MEILLQPRDGDTLSVNELNDGLAELAIAGWARDPLEGWRQTVPIQFGLGSALFDTDQVGELGRRLDALGSDEQLRLFIESDQPAIQAIPWEYARVNHPALAAPLALESRLSLIRVLDRQRRAWRAPNRDPRVLLIVGGERAGLDPLCAAAEVSEIVRVLTDEGVPHDTADQLSSLARVEESIARGYSCVHIIAHGVTLSDGTRGVGIGRHHDMSATRLAEIAARSALAVVTLSVCNTGGHLDPTQLVAMETARSGVPWTVAMHGLAEAGHTKPFFRAFYRSLAESGDVEAAIVAGRLELHRVAQLNQYGQPVLFQGTAEPVRVELARHNSARSSTGDPDVLIEDVSVQGNATAVRGAPSGRVTVRRWDVAGDFTAIDTRWQRPD